MTMPYEQPLALLVLQGDRLESMSETSLPLAGLVGCRSAPSEPGIKGVAQCFTNHVVSGYGQKDHQTGKDGKPDS